MAKKLKLPKQIAGVKIPKTIRKGPIGQFVGSSAGQLLLAEALFVAAGAFAVRNDPTANQIFRHPIEGLKQAGRSTGRVTEDVKASLSRRSERLACAFDRAVQAFRDALDENSGVQAATAEPADKAQANFVNSTIEGATAQRLEDEPSKKKPSSSGRDATTPH